MKRGNEHDLVVAIYLIFALALELPVNVIDKDKNTRAAKGGRCCHLKSSI
jgi:hypothetical protein